MCERWDGWDKWKKAMSVEIDLQENLRVRETKEIEVNMPLGDTRPNMFSHSHIGQSSKLR